MDYLRNPDTDRYLAENAATEHMLLSPVRWFASFIKWSLLLTAVFGYYLWNNAGWIVNVGDHSQKERQAKIETIEAGLVDHGYNTVRPDYGDFKIDLSHRSEAMNWDESHEHPADAWRYWLTWVRTDADYQMAAGITAHGIAGTIGDYPEVCALSLDSSNFDTNLHGWEGRSDDSFRRKSARMYSAYANAAIMATVLRSTLTRLKLHEDPLNGPNVSFAAGGYISACNADPMDIRQVSKAKYEQWVATSQSIHLNHAPVIELRYANLSAVVTYQGHETRGITGMCLANECSPDDLMFSTTKSADLFDPNPPLSDHQANAVQALDALSTDAFWLAAAHDNGIHQDELVEQAADSARVMRNAIIWPQGKPGALPTR